jgi:hypothetical protein
MLAIQNTGQGEVLPAVVGVRSVAASELGTALSGVGLEVLIFI